MGMGGTLQDPVRTDYRETATCVMSTMIEKVKLPTFSGRHADFTDLRSQFRELCHGERYTPVLEMAQLRTKLPKEALALLIGLQCPEEAWKRLEELYGNRELAILSALKRLREFKATKQGAHEQVIKLAGAVQRCQTELGNVKALDELLNDRESVACIIYALPPTVKDKWYDREAPEDSRARAEYLLKWIEVQRQNAVRVRLDVMAAQLRVVASPHGQPGRSQPQPETTDKGLLSSSLHVQGEGAEGRLKGPTRIEVKTMADAQKVADRRQANLVSRKLDKCPVCGQAHHYEKTWPDTQPPVKAQLLSTYLTSCTAFLAPVAGGKDGGSPWERRLHPLCLLGPSAPQVPRREAHTESHLFCPDQRPSLWSRTREVVP